MRLLLFLMLLLSISANAQRKKIDPQKKSDSAKFKISRDTVKTEIKRKNLNNMPVFKPNDSIYSGLKSSNKNHSQYKILNATPKEKEKTSK
ncbi:hypothetical protein ABEG63_19085 [Chryseobacterium sp. C39-AII1]|uniref:hypothetical protein n=1 Tax=Chryseobacterium sp. C39-AII1 TaxID=3080332 RepID=UPI00320A592C